MFSRDEIQKSGKISQHGTQCLGCVKSEVVQGLANTADCLADAKRIAFAPEN
jgi:hypothetical protein